MNSGLKQRSDLWMFNTTVLVINRKIQIPNYLADRKINKPISLWLV